MNKENVSTDGNGLHAIIEPKKEVFHTAMMDMFYLKLTLAGNIMDENNREEIIKKLADVYKSLEQVERVLDISEVELFGSEIKSLNEVDNG